MVEEFYKRAAAELDGMAFLVLVWIWHRPDLGPDGKIFPVTVCQVAHLLNLKFGDVTLVMRELEVKGWIKLIWLDKFGRNHRWEAVPFSEVPDLTEGGFGG